MAQITKLVDDIDGESDAEMTLSFGLDGVEYEIDLNDTNYENFRATLELLSSKGRVVVREPVKAKRTLSTGKKTGTAGKTQHIREWARENGFPNLSDRGRIPQNIMDAYETRSRMPQKVVEAPKDEPKGEDTPETVSDADKANEAAVIARVKSQRPKPARGGKRVLKSNEMPELRELLSLEGADKE